MWRRPRSRGRAHVSWGQRWASKGLTTEPARSAADKWPMGIFAWPCWDIYTFQAYRTPQHVRRIPTVGYRVLGRRLN